MSITGEPEGEPTKGGVALVDVLTGKDATIGILAALQERERSGDGQRIEVNLLSSLLGALANQTSSYLTTGAAPARMGNRHPSIAPYETLRCADGMLAVACGNDGQFARICAVLGRPDLAEDPRFATNPARVSNRPTLNEALEKELKREDVSVWAERLTAVGVAAGAVNDLGGALELAERLGLSPTTSVGVGHPDQVRHPITWSRSPLRTPTPPPTLGEHSTVLRTRLEDTP